MARLSKAEKLRRKKARPPSKAKLKRKASIARRKALAEWSAKVRAVGKCAVCGATEFLNAHHLLPKERYPEFALVLENGICLCTNHHKYHRFSAHRNSIWFVIWLRSNHPHIFHWAKRNMGNWR